MQEIEKQALKTFGENMEYFSKEQSKLHKKLAILQQAMENGQYKQNYALEYQDGYFDVKDLRYNTWYYGMDSNEFAKQKADDITYEKMDKSFSMLYRFLYTDAMLEDMKQMSAINFSMALVAPVEHILSLAGGQQKNMTKIYKFAFLGIGPGVHIKAIDEKIKAESYLFVENNLELFYLSLFIVDYVSIAKRAKVFFSIMDDSTAFGNVFGDFYIDIVMRNDFLKFSLLSDEYAIKIKQMQSNVLMESHFAYPVEYLLRKSLRISRVIKKDYKFLNISRIYTNTPISAKKVLFLAGGPSLHKHLDWVKENQDKFTIISVFSIANKLAKEGIKVDIFTHIDEDKGMLFHFIKDIENLKYFKDSIFILSSSVSMEFFEKFVPKENIYLTEDRARYKDKFGFLDIYSIGEATSMLSIILGATNFYTLGLDMALDQETGKSHADGHISSEDKGLEFDEADEIKEGSSLRGTLLPVKGSKRPTVYTTPLFEASLNVIRNWNERNITSQKIYNLSDGAFISKTIPYEVEDVVFDGNDKRIDIEKIKEFMDSISSDKLSEKEKHNLVIRKQEVKKNIKVVKRFSETKIKDKEHFHEMFINLIVKTAFPVEDNLVEISSIFKTYLMRIASHVGEYLNTEDANYSQKTLEGIRDCIAFQLNKLLHSIGLWEFGFANPYKFFENLENKPYEKIRYAHNFIGSRISQIKEARFFIQVNDDWGENKFGNIKMPEVDKKIVGILALDYNTNNQTYIDYIKGVLENNEDLKIIAFYFEEEHKDLMEERIKDSKIEYKQLKQVKDIVSSVNAFIFHSRDSNIILPTEIQLHLYMQTHFPKMRLIKSDKEFNL